MVFSSGLFLFAFLPIVLIAYFIPFFKDKCGKVARRYKNIVLLIASLVFYWWGEPLFFFIMCLSIFVNWGAGLLINNHRQKTKLITTLCCIYDVGILFVFKYLKFVTQNIALLTGNQSVIMDIVLPIGISFFTFQMMSYVFDVARQNAVCQKNILNMALYVTMFPQLIAGPIVRYETVANEIDDRKENLDEFFDGVCRFIKGLAKKVLLANQLGVLADMIFDNEIKGTSVCVAWLGAIAYTLQIFYDFSGYSDMAIGLGKIFGFHFLENFDFPYISKSITEFWRRWHISMGTWFRDYVYFPLGGSRVDTKAKLIRNLFVVWLLTGIWHGANWTFVVWGLMYFVLLCVEKLTGFQKHLGWLSRLYTLFFVVLGWVLFRSDSLGFAWQYIRLMFGLSGNPFINQDVFRLAGGFIVVLLLGIVFSLPIEKRIDKMSESKSVFLRVLYVLIQLLIIFLVLIYVIKGGYNPFIYFNF